MHKELSGDFRQAVEWSFYSRAQVNAAALRKAMKGSGTDEAMLIDVICTANNHEIKKIKDAYEECEFLFKQLPLHLPAKNTATLWRLSPLVFLSLRIAKLLQ